MRMYRKAHWLTKISVNTVFIVMNDAWNESRAKKVATELDEQIDKIEDREWHTIALLSGVSVLTPEAFEFLKPFAVKRVAQGLKSLTIVHKDSCARSIAEYQCEELYKALSNSVAFCENREQAINWSRSQGANFEEKIFNDLTL